LDGAILAIQADCNLPAGTTFTIVSATYLMGTFDTSSGQPIASGDVIASTPASDGTCSAGAQAPYLEISSSTTGGVPEVTATVVSYTLSAPTGLAATLGDGSATVSWVAPASNGGSAVTSYTLSVTDTTTSNALTPVVVSGSPPATSTVVSGLTPGDTYVFAVNATNAVGTGPASAGVTEIVPAPYHPVSPARICDTRPAAQSGITDACTGNTLGAGTNPETITVQVAGNGGVPVGATAVVANVTVTNPTAQGYLTVYPAGGTRPLASNLNFAAGETVPNLVTVPLSSSGAISIYNAAGATDVIVDVTGYYGPANVSSPGVGFSPLSPARICDTRPTPQSGITDACTGNTRGAAGNPETITVQVAGNAGVPTGATAVVANVTVTNPTAQSYLTVYPAGATQPLASNLNFNAGETVPNRVIIPLSAGGALNIFNAAGATDVIVDVTGYYSSSSTGLYEALSPARICDTRPTPQSGITDACTTNTLGAGANPETITVQVAGNAGVPTGAAAVVANVTVTNTTAQSYLTVYPAGATQPLASDLNWTAGVTVPNLVIAKLGATGTLNVFNAAGSTDVIIDVTGWFT
jgi:hypothetical protein